VTDKIEDIEPKGEAPVPVHFVENKIVPLYPTPLFVGKLSDITLCDRLETLILTKRDKKEGMFEAGNFVTSDQLHTLSEFEEMTQLILAETNHVLDFLKVKRDSHYVNGMWANVTDPNHRHPIHIHPNNLLSGILYIKTPEKCGGTAFPDPRPGARVFEPSYEEIFELNAGNYVHPAIKGLMLIWPSWVPHGVERGFNDTKEDRITIAFNVQMVGTITTQTAKLELK
jgi:uncharacterized protein (TIGR02466 family)